MLWCLQRGITLRAQHLPGQGEPQGRFHVSPFEGQNRLAALFNLINQTWGTLLVDLFATGFSHQLPRVFSWWPQTPSCRTGGTCTLMRTHRGV